MNHIVVIGGGQAAASLVRRLRAQGFDGKISLFCGEAKLPYERPPLSKKFLLNANGHEALAIFPQSFYADNAIDCRMSAWVSAIDPLENTLVCDGETLSYDVLVLATGASARPLSVAGRPAPDGLFQLRSVRDAKRLRRAMEQARSCLVIGGGYIGLETAATASKLGLSVTVIELGERILQRVASPNLSDRVRSLHVAQGLDIREAINIVSISKSGAAKTVALSDGSSHSVDMIIAGVGAAPRTELAKSAGLQIENGIRTDAFGQTSSEAIWAVGDCASIPIDGQQRRLESVQNAIDHAELVADNILGAQSFYKPVPTFWSEQFDAVIQIVGLRRGNETVVARPGSSDQSGSYWLFGNGHLRAVETFNDKKTYAIARRLVAAGKSPLPGDICNPDTDLKAILRNWSGYGNDKIETNGRRTTNNT